MCTSAKRTFFCLLNPLKILGKKDWDFFGFKSSYLNNAPIMVERFRSRPISINDFKDKTSTQSSEIN